MVKPGDAASAAPGGAAGPTTIPSPAEAGLGPGHTLPDLPVVCCRLVLLPEQNPPLSWTTSRLAAPGTALLLGFLGSLCVCGDACEWGCEC